MKPLRHMRSILFGLFFGFAYAIITNSPDPEMTIFIAFIGVLVPNIDVKFMTKISDTPKELFVNMFLIPLLLTLTLGPRLLSSFFIGYYGHVVNDLDKQNNIEFAKQRAFVSLLWVLAITIIMLVFNLNFTSAVGLFS